MGVYKYTGKKGPVYFVDYYFNGKRFREQVGPNKSEKAGQNLVRNSGLEEKGLSSTFTQLIEITGV